MKGHFRELIESKKMVLFIFILISIVFCQPILRDISNSAGNDWPVHLTIRGVARESILAYRQLPLWNPYLWGGNVLLANPHEGFFFSPALILILLFGTEIGVKLEILFYYIIGMFGMFLLCKQFKMSKIASLLPPILFMLNSYHSLHLTEGHDQFMHVAFLPYIILFYLKGIARRRYVLLSAIFFSLIFLIKSGYIFAYTFLFLVMFSILLSVMTKKLIPFKALNIILIFFILLSSIKLIPMLDFLQQIPPRVMSVDDGGHLTVKAIINIFLNRTQRVDPYNKDIFEYQAAGWHEYGCYVGILPILLFLLAIPFLLKKKWPLILTGIAFFVLACGNFAEFSLWSLLHRLPFFDCLRVPSRSIIMFIFCFSILSGMLLSRFEEHRFMKYKHYNLLKDIFCGILVFLILIDLYVVNSVTFNDAFTLPKPLTDKSKPFKQVSPNYDGYFTVYIHFLRNEGTVFSDEAIRLPLKAIPSDSPLYKGEVFLAKGRGSAVTNFWSPNKIDVDVALASENGRIIINQNYVRGWKVNDGRHVEPYQGLISAEIFPGDKQLIFYYLPDSFLLGALLSSLGIILLVILWKRKPMHA